MIRGFFQTKKKVTTHHLKDVVIRVKFLPWKARTSLKMSELLEKKSLCIDQLQRQAGEDRWIDGMGMLGGSSHDLGYVVNNHGDCKSP